MEVERKEWSVYTHCSRTTDLLRCISKKRETAEKKKQNRQNIDKKKKKLHNLHTIKHLQTVR